MSDLIKDRLAALKQSVASGEKAVEPENDLVTRKIKPYKISVKDLRLLIESNPDHKVAKDFALGIRGLGPDTMIVVDRVQLTGLIENKEVEKSRETVETEDGSIVVERNVLSDS